MKKIYLDKWKSTACEVLNFLDEDELTEAKTLLDSVEINSNEVITTNKLKKANPFNKDIDAFCHKIEKKYEPFMKNILKKLAPHKVNIPSKLKCILSVLPPNSNYEIHEDKLEKVLSGVIYLSEKKNIGTLIHDSKYDTEPYEINYEENKNFIFSRNHNVSWHSYKSNENKRYTMIINLITDKKFNHLKSEIGYLGGGLYYTKNVLFLNTKKFIFKYLKIVKDKIK